MRGIGPDTYYYSEAVMLLIYFLGFYNGEPAIAKIKRPARIVKNLRAGILCRINIIGLE